MSPGLTSYVEYLQNLNLQYPEITFSVDVRYKFAKIFLISQHFNVTVVSVFQIAQQH